MKPLERFLRRVFFALVVKPFMTLVMGIHVVGREHLPEGQFVLVANHSSHLDTLVLLSLFPLDTLLRIRPVAAADYWTKNPLIHALTRFLFHILPIPRRGITPENNPLRLMEEALEAGDSLLIYPEGTRDYGEDIGPFKPGVAHLLKRHPELPCVPVYIRNTARILPKGTFLFVPLFVDVVVGKPLVFPPEMTKKEIRSRLEEAVRDLARRLEESDKA